MLLKYYPSPVKNGQFVMFLSGSEDLTQTCLNLSTWFLYKFTLFHSVQVCDSFVFIIASLIVARHFWRISLLGSVQNAILLPYMHTQNHTRMPHTFIAMALCQLCSAYHDSLMFLKKTGWSCSMNVLLFLGHIDTWPWLCKGVTAKRCVLQGSDHTP